MDQHEYPLATAKLRAKQLNERGVDGNVLYDSIELLCDKEHLHDSLCYRIPEELS
jgi:hypothetical protein